MLPREFYTRDTNVVARELIGKKLIHQSESGYVSAMIVETEAYAGPMDDACHAFGGKRSKRTEIMFSQGGFAYVYFIYGMHCCFNVVTEGDDFPAAVFIRAAEPIDGIEIMEGNRGVGVTKRNLTNGPGKLCKAMNIGLGDYGTDLCGDKIYIEEFRTVSESDIISAPRVNVDYAEEYAEKLWRYYLFGNEFVSKASGKKKK